MSTSGPITVNGDFNIGQTFDAGSYTHHVKGFLSVGFEHLIAGSGTIVLNGTTPQVINGNISFNNLSINNPVGVAMIFSQDTVLGTLRFIDGNILLNNNDFIIGPNATVNGADSGKCVVTNDRGVVKHRIAGGASAENFQFPVGPTLTTYNPLTIALQNNSSEPGETFGVGVSLLDNAAPGFATIDTSLFAWRIWTITERIPGANHANLTFQWNRNDEGSRIGIAHGSPVSVTTYRYNPAPNRYQFVDSAGGSPPTGGLIVAATSGFRAIHFDSTAYIVGRGQTSTSADVSGISGTFILDQNYPNPFNPTTRISFDLARTEHVTLKVYDIVGKEVATLVNETRPAGRYSEQFDASRLSSGVYMYRLTTPTQTATKKLVLMK